jgi:hypothetical protein
VSVPIGVSANWAVWSKRPGSREDYGVLAASTGRFSRSDYATILLHFSAGTPVVQRPGDDIADSDRRAAGELPWVSVNWVGVDDQLHLGLAIQRATKDVDGVGRQIVETSYFCVSYAALAEKSVSYADLWESVRELRLPREDGDPLELQLPALDIEAMASRITSLGERSVALVADRLLSGPVSITRADGSTLGQRLQFLDAVAAMLPYGYRTRFTASTWSDSGVRHRIRLAFAERRYSGAEVYVWGSAEADRNPTRVDPESYLGQVDRLRGRSPDSLKKFELSDIIRHLVADTSAQRFDQPRPAIDSLASMDLPFAVLGAVREQRADPSRVRELFSGGRITELPPDARTEVFAVLVGYGEPGDWPAVTQWWDTVAAYDPSRLIPALGQSCRRQLWGPRPDAGALNAHVTLAARTRHTDQLLSQVVARPEHPQALVRGLAVGAELLSRWVMESGNPKGFPLTLAALAAIPELTCELTAYVAVTSPRGRADKVELLRRAMPRLLAPFADLVTSAAPKAVSSAAISTLTGNGVICLGSLLHAADGCRHLEQVLPGLVQWLVSQPGLDPDSLTYLEGLLRGLSPLTPEQWADVDLALLTVGGTLTFMPGCTTGQEAKRYAGQFAERWRSVSRYKGVNGPDPFVFGFVRSLDDGRWASDGLQVHLVQDICTQLAGPKEQPAFASLLTSVLIATPEARQWPWAVDWVQRFDDPKAVALSSTNSLARLPARTGPDQIVAVCYRAFFNEVSAKSAGSALARSDALSQAANVDDVLTAVRSVFWADQPTADRPRLWRALTARVSDSDRLRSWFEDVLRVIVAARRRLPEPVRRDAGQRPDGGPR